MIGGDENANPNTPTTGRLDTITQMVTTFFPEEKKPTVDPSIVNRVKEMGDDSDSEAIIVQKITPSEVDVENQIKRLSVSTRSSHVSG